MTNGLEKILKQIEEEADLVVSQKEEATEASLKEIRQKADDEANRQIRKIEEQAAASAKSMRERMESRRDFNLRNLLLETKQEIIGNVLKKALEDMEGAPDQVYFDYIKKMVKRYARPAEGKIQFGKRDLERMPEGMEAEIRTLAEAKGGSLDFSGEAAAIDSGFILIYGGVEENCSFAALFHDKKDDLQDKAGLLLFAEE